MAKKRTILIDGWGSKLAQERKGMAKKRTILIDGWGLENSLKFLKEIGLKSMLSGLVDG